MRRIVITLIIFLSFNVIAQSQVKSPEEFLGYKIGSKFTPYWKVSGYFNYVAMNASSMMKLQSYGETNEGRSLLLAIVSSPENIRNLESIRENNRRLSNLENDKGKEENAPAIVWLSYNVHGNEASSTEAAMLTLFALVDPSNTKTKEWLKNTVVIIDPCLNPDGRDRYVNWYNSISGRDPNTSRAAREHNEPWPGGRTNHYYFDLNRDWAWQTQVESKQRIRIYHQWMPQVHVDFHEQGINGPYYFAPAAEPFHEVITPWQRSFQNTIGKNHARYFDENGWLYYTREEYDLFYPSYGDTWPIYNGAIGMTYEQAGHGNAGLAVINDEGDTLSLYDRALHHYTTSLSTIEVSSKNATQLVKEFHKYYNDAVNAGAGEYKTYVIKGNPRNIQRFDALIDLLRKNEIVYSRGSGSGKGYNYATGKEESFSISTSDLVISSNQPHAALVKVLMEPQSKLVDSVTYDITAWSVPYAYGLDAYASRDRISISNVMVEQALIPIPPTTYGYLIPWNGIKTVKAVGELLQRGLTLRYAEEPFSIEGKSFDRGTIIILRTANRSIGNDLWTICREVANANQVQMIPVRSGFVDTGFDFGSGKVHPFKAPRVALLTGEGVYSNSSGEIWHFFEQQIKYPITLINANDVGRVSLSDFDVIIMPDGSYRFLSDKSGADALKSWVNKGGRLVALEGAVASLAKAEFGIKMKKSEEEKKTPDDDYSALKKFEDRERDEIRGSIPGSIFKVEMDVTHPLAFGYGNYYYTLKRDTSIYEFFKEGGWNVGVIKKDNQVSGFVGSKLRDKLKDGLLFGVQQMRDGCVTYLADDVIFRSFWENGKLMLCNAVFLVNAQ